MKKRIDTSASNRRKAFAKALSKLVIAHAKEDFHEALKEFLAKQAKDDKASQDHKPSLLHQRILEGKKTGDGEEPDLQ